MTITTKLNAVDQSLVDFHEFEVDNAIIKDLIFSQNGTVATAIRELIMNAIDAGSPTCHINIGPSGFEVIDTGHGFKDKESVLQYFKRFGKPHKEGDATFGRFRIGRGQIMAFAKVTWHSNEFKMVTDIKSADSGFNLIENAVGHFNGCKVSGSFYQSLQEHSVNHIVAQIRNLVRYAKQDITINGITIKSSIDAWDIDDDDLQVKWNPDRGHGIHLYSLGVFVKEVSAYNYGLNADIVTKKALQLNMARNEISETDPLWTKITSILRARTIELGEASQKDSNSLDELTRKSLIRQVVDQETDICDLIKMPLLRDYRGHKFTLWSFANNGTRPIIVAPNAGNRICDHLASTRTATVLHHEELKIWQEETLESLRNSLVNYLSTGQHERYIRSLRNELCSLNICSFEEIAANFNDKHELLPLKNLTARERAARIALEYASGVMARRLTSLNGTAINKRAIKAGESQVADAWTDGATYIAVSRHMYSLLDQGYSGAVQLALLMLHEYLHGDSDTGSHEHNFAFYERFHHTASEYRDNEIVGHTATSIYNRYNSALTEKGLALPDPVKAVFKFPLVNDIEEYIGRFDGKAKLSALSMILLNFAKSAYISSELEITKSTLRFAAAVKSRKTNIVAFCLKDTLFHAAEADGYVLPNKKELKARILTTDSSGHISPDSYKRYKSEILRLRVIVLSEWAENQGHDFTIIEDIISDSKRYLLPSLLQLVCRDKNSNLNYFESSSLRKVIERVGAEYHHEVYTSSRTYWGDHNCNNGWNNGALAGSRHVRFNFAIESIKDIVNGMTDINERNEFVNTFFNRTLAIQFQVATNEDS